MIIDEIIIKAKNNVVNVFFDMDGTLAEYDNDTSKLRYVKGSNYYVGKRPLYCIINEAKSLAKNKNIRVHILSNCPLEEQIKQKIDWLNEYMPFLEKDNIHIICYENISFSKEEKPYLKGKYIKNLIKNNEYSYLIEDDHSNIKATNTFENICALHVTNFLR